MKRPAAGFTLVELLVGMALMGVILLALVNFFGQSSRISAQSSSRAELQQELLNAQQLIAGKLKEAWYVYPPGQAIQMTTTALTRKPSGGNQWLVGTDPILAMVLPPQTAGGVYRFLAYYPVRRSVWISGLTTADSWRNPGPDDQNANTWVLAEYRGSIAAGAGGAPPSTPPTVPVSNTPNILSDYIAPTVLMTGLTMSSNIYTMFTYAAADGNPPSVSNPVNSVTVNLAVARQTQGKLLRLPGATGTYNITVFPANLGRVAAN